MEKQMTRLERTAHHEAGHAVAAHCLDIRIKRISIIEDGTTLGYVQSDFGFRFESWGQDLTPSQMEKLEKRAIMILAGGTAEWIACGETPRGTGRDFDTVADYVLKLHSSKKVASAYIARLCAAAGELMGRPENVRGVARLATVLLDRKILDGEEAHSLIRNFTCPEPSDC